MKALVPSRMTPAAHKVADFFAILEEGTTPEDLLDPAFWMQHGHTMHPMSKVRAFEESGAWYAEFLILDAGRTFAKLAILPGTFAQLGGVEPAAAPSGYSIRYKGQIHKFQVIRDADGAIVRSELPSKAAAVEWLSDFLKSVAA